MNKSLKNICKKKRIIRMKNATNEFYIVIWFTESIFHHFKMIGQYLIVNALDTYHSALQEKIKIINT